MYLLFSSDILNFMLKTNVGRYRRTNFVIFIVLSASIVGGWVGLEWSRKSYSEPAESILL